MANWKIKPTEGQQYPTPEAGQQLAVLVAIIDLGTQTDETFGDAHKVFFVWELTDQPLGGEGSGNLTVGCDYTWSTHETSNLGKLIAGLRGAPVGKAEEYDISNLLGRGMVLNLVVAESKASGKKFVRVSGAAAPHKSIRIPPAKIKPLLWSLEDGTPPPDFAWMPWVRGVKAADRISQCVERRGGAPDKAAGGAEESPPADEVPF